MLLREYRDVRINLFPMSKRNHFSDKFDHKTADELRIIIADDGYQNQAIAC